MFGSITATCLHGEAGMSHPVSPWTVAPAALPIVAASTGSCLIGRDLLGRFVVSHAAQPGDVWVAANLPTAHAVCRQLCHQRGSINEVE